MHEARILRQSFGGSSGLGVNFYHRNDEFADRVEPETMP